MTRKGRQSLRDKKRSAFFSKADPGDQRNLRSRNSTQLDRTALGATSSLIADILQTVNPLLLKNRCEPLVDVNIRRGVFDDIKREIEMILHGFTKCVIHIKRFRDVVDVRVPT